MASQRKEEDIQIAEKNDGEAWLIAELVGEKGARRRLRGAPAARAGPRAPAEVHPGGTCPEPDELPELLEAVLPHVGSDP